MNKELQLLVITQQLWNEFVEAGFIPKQKQFISTMLCWVVNSTTAMWTIS